MCIEIRLKKETIHEFIAPYWLNISVVGQKLRCENSLRIHHRAHIFIISLAGNVDISTSSTIAYTLELDSPR